MRQRMLIAVFIALVVGAALFGLGASAEVASARQQINLVRDPQWLWPNEGIPISCQDGSILKLSGPVAYCKR